MNTIIATPIYKRDASASHQEPLDLLRKLASEGKSICIAGRAGVGKTTILHDLLKCTGEVTPINILENMPEIFPKLKEEYPNRSIVNIGYEEAKSKIEFWDTNYVLRKEELSVTRSILGITRLVLGVGEIHDYVTAIYPLIAKQFYGSVQVMFTHHAMNAHDMVTSIKNCLLERGASLDEAVAATAKLFDVYVHVDKIDGSFCITEIDSVNLQNISEIDEPNLQSVCAFKVYDSDSDDCADNIQKHN